jgi:hypothetical protein
MVISNNAGAILTMLVTSLLLFHLIQALISYPEYLVKKINSLQHLITETTQQPSPFSVRL